MSRLRWGAPFAAAFLLSAPFAGCDDGGGGGSAPDLSITFVSPLEGAALDCGDDLDRDTDDALDFTVEALVALKGSDPEGLTARLTAEGHDGFVQTAPVPESGRVLFGGAPLPLADELVLKVALLDGDEEVATATRTVGTSIDPDSPECRTTPQPPALSFDRPADGAVFGAADDADGDLGNGLQIEVVVAVDGRAPSGVALEVDGAATAETSVADGKATFATVTLPVAAGGRDVRLAATAPGTAARTEIGVRVEIDACSLTVAPQPAGDGCDVLAAADLDPNMPGVQVALTAETNCARVVFAVNGADAAPIAVEDGVARLEVTLAEGENTIAARATGAGGLSAEVDPYVLVVDAAPPAVRLDGLSELGDNRFGYEGNERLPEGGFRATLRGTAEGLPAGSTLRVAFDPPLPGDFDGEATVAEDGTFAVAADITSYACGRTLTVTATDDCGNEGRSPAYAVCFDPVEPRLAIVTPGAGAVIPPGEDAEPDLPGQQIAVAVQVEDPRPAEVDYDIFVECQLPGGQFQTRTRPEHVARRADADAEGRVAVTVTLGAGDQGAINCRAAAEPSPNAALADAVAWTVLSDTPTFELTQPAAGQCFGAGEVVVGGSGRRLTANGASLQAVLTPAGGGAGAPVALEAQADDTFAVTFGGASGPEALADGRYHVDVSGRVMGDVAVAVSPAAGVDFVVDSTAPGIELLAPADGSELGPEQDADGDASNCVQTALQLQLSDLSATRLCYTINGSAEFCANVDENGVFAPEVDLLDGDNVVGVRAVDCGGNETTRTFHLGALGCPPRVQVVAPVDGARLSAAADVDPEAAGVQLDVRVESALDEGTEIVVAVTSGEQDATFGPVAVDAGGAATVRVTVELPAAPEGPFAFRLQARLADGSASGPGARITFLFTPPTIDLPELGACLGGAYVDAAVAPGFQLALTATTTGVDPGAVATVSADCGGAPVEAQGVVGDDGAVAFGLLTLPEDAACTFTARVTDAAGQAGSDALALRIDRVAPRITVTRPADGSQVTQADDEVPGDELPQQGIQLTPEIEVCGAAGQVLTVVTEPALSDDGEPFALAIGEGDCATVSLGRRTLPAGDLRFAARATDACGNEGTVVSAAAVNPASAISIRLPADGRRILADDDTDENLAGCQVRLVAGTDQLGAGAEFFVCTSVDQGAGPEACDGRSSALAPAGCSVGQGAGGPELDCTLSLQDGRHTLTVVGVFGAPVESDPVTVEVDCTSPVVQAFAVPQDANADACLNRVERRRPGRLNDRAEFDLRATITGIEDGRSVTLLRAPDRSRVTSAIIANGQVEFPLDLDQGTYNLYLSSSDAAGNRLPDFNDPEAVLYRVQIDTLRPETALVGLAAGACLNAGADADPAANGLQYGVRVSAVGQAGEALTGRLAIDEGAPVEQAAVGGQVAFPAQAIGEGAHAVRVTVRDACGNTASVAGFERGADNLDDWSRPLPVSFVVDTVAPAPVVVGLADGAVLTDDDDADDDPANGFQTDLGVDFDPRAGIEAGRPVELRANGRPLATVPAALTVPANFAAPIDARITLGPGEQSITAVAGDACGNVGTSAPVDVSARLSGCPSELVFAESPVVYGPGDGVAGAGTLTVAGIDGTVAVGINPECVGAQAELVTGPAGAPQVLGAVAVPAGGGVRFANVALPRGIDDLRIRIVLNGRTTFSPTERVFVDLDAPVVAITTPAAPEPAPVQADADGNPANGLQTTVIARVTEANVATNSVRGATLEVDGQQVARRDGLDQTSPLDITFADVTLAEGPATLRICVTDAAGNQGCATRQVLVDPAAPAAPEVAFEIVNPRTTEVELTFAAPGDNGAEGGPVAAFEVRRSSSPIADDNAWNLATLVGNYPNTAEALGAGAPFQPGAEVVLSLVDDAALPLHQNHFVAVRAVDDAGRLGAIGAANVDLRLRTVQIDIGPANFWPGEVFVNQRSTIQGLGDVNGDGHADALVSALAYDAQFTEFRQVVLLLSAPSGEPADIQAVPLAVPTVNGAPLFAFGGYAGSVGDVDADGVPDFAVVGVAGGSGAVALYFGGGDAAALAAADVVIVTPGRFVTYVNGIGNFNQLAADGATAYGDLAIGGASGNANNFVNIVAGRSRAAWTAAPTIDASQYNAANGITRLVAGAAGATVAAAGRSIDASDIDGDGRTEVLFSAGGSWGRVFLFEGGDNLAATLTHPVANNGSREVADLCPPVGGTPSFWGSNISGGIDLDGQAGDDFVIGNYNIKKIVPVSAGLQRLDCFGRGPASYGALMNVAGDIDADGALDLIASHFDDGNTSAHLFFNDGAGRFGGADVNGQREADVTLGTNFPRRKIGIDGLGDIDRDGFDDFGVVYKEPGGALRAVLYY